jgi:hypothetical protein
MEVLHKKEQNAQSALFFNEVVDVIGNLYKGVPALDYRECLFSSLIR